MIAELNFGKVARRNPKKVVLKHLSELNASQISLKDEAVLIQQKFREKMQSKPKDESDRLSILQLFNEQLADLVKLLPEGYYVEADAPGEATHILQATSWNTEPTLNMPAGTFALSVCAVPLRPRVGKTNIKIKKPLPKNLPAYKSTSALGGKQNVVRFMVKATKAKVPAKVISRLTNAECDLLYQNLHRASKLLKIQRALA